jgi:outer membrane protein
MIRRFLLLATTLSALLSANASAQTTNAVKIGVLNVFRVIAECAEGKQANEEFQRKFEAKKEELDKKQRELQDLQRQLQSQSKTLNDESRVALTKSIETKATDLKRSQEDGDKEFTNLRSQIFNRIGNRLSPIVDQYAKEYGHTLILDSSNQATQIVYSDPAIEITDDIVKRLDASQISSKTPAPAVLKAPAPSDKKIN